MGVLMPRAAWAGAVLVALGCQFIGGIDHKTSGGPCVTNEDCPHGAICVDRQCKGPSTSTAGVGGSGTGGKGSAGSPSAGGRAPGGASGAGALSGSSGSDTVAAGTGGVGGTGGMDGTGGGSSGSHASGGVVSQGGDAGETTTAGEGGEPNSGRGGTGGGRGGSSNGGTGGGGAGNGGSSADAGKAGGGMGGGGSVTQRIMVIGDGITATSCVRAFLYKKLIDESYRTFDFIGSLSGGPTCSGVSSYDEDHCTHSRYLVSNIAGSESNPGTDPDDPYSGSSADLDTWFNGRPADVALMMIGTNDVLGDRDTVAILDGYTAILGKLRSVSEDVRMLVAKVPPVTSSSCPTSCKNALVALNGAIDGWVAAQTTNDSPIGIVDMYTDFSTSNLSDGLHLNDAGSQEIADRWYAALSAE